MPVPVSSLSRGPGVRDQRGPATGHCQPSRHVIGPGGIGKSRLADRGCSSLDGNCPRTADRVGRAEPAVRRRHPDCHRRRSTDATRRGSARCGRRGSAGVPALLVFDTCEHVLDGAAMAASKSLRLNPDLASGHEPSGPRSVGRSGVAGPSVGARGLGRTRGGRCCCIGCCSPLCRPAAAAARPGFVLDDENAASIAQICRSLDGLPLAIELAAGEGQLVVAARIVERLSDRFALLTHGGRDVEARRAIAPRDSVNGVTSC